MQKKTDEEAEEDPQIPETIMEDSAEAKKTPMTVRLNQSDQETPSSFI